MVMARNGPDKSHREGITVMELADMFPNEGKPPAHAGARPRRRQGTHRRRTQRWRPCRTASKPN